MEIKAKDIVDISGGNVSFATAGKWLKSKNPSVAVRYALEYFRLRLLGAVASDAHERQADMPKKVRTLDGPIISPPVPNESERLPIAKRKGHAFASDMTYKAVNGPIRLNFDEGWYLLSEKSERFLIEGVTGVKNLSDFTEL